MTEAHESSPLLAVETNHAEANNLQNGIVSFPEIATYTAAQDFFPRPVKLLTIAILVFSVTSFMVLVAANIVVAIAPWSRVYYYPGASEIEAVGALVLLAFIAAILNIRVKIPILINFLIDIFLVCNFLPSISELFDHFPKSGWCLYNRYDPSEGAKPGCLPWVLAAKILVAVGGGLAALIGLFQMVLLLLRVVAAWKSKFWRRPSVLNFPTGELSFQFTIKFLRQEPATMASPTAAAPSQSAELQPNGR